MRNKFKKMHFEKKKLVKEKISQEKLRMIEIKKHHDISEAFEMAL